MRKPGRRIPNKTPATFAYAPIVVAMAASSFGNQFDVTFAGALYMNGWPRAMKVYPMMHQKNPLLIRHLIQSPTTVSIIPHETPTLSPNLSSIYTEGKLATAKRMR